MTTPLVSTAHHEVTVAPATPVLQGTQGRGWGVSTTIYQSLRFKIVCKDNVAHFVTFPLVPPNDSTNNSDKVLYDSLRKFILLVYTNHPSAKYNLIPQEMPVDIDEFSITYTRHDEDVSLNKLCDLPELLSYARQAKDTIVIKVKQGTRHVHPGVPARPNAMEKHVRFQDEADAGVEGEVTSDSDYDSDIVFSDYEEESDNDDEEEEEEEEETVKPVRQRRQKEVLPPPPSPPEPIASSNGNTPKKPVRKQKEAKRVSPGEIITIVYLISVAILCIGYGGLPIFFCITGSVAVPLVGMTIYEFLPRKWQKEIESEWNGNGADKSSSQKKKQQQPKKKSTKVQTKKNN